MIQSISLLRALAVIFVMYDHLVGMWLTKNNVSWPPEEIISGYILEPFGIFQHGGAFAVALFFLVSGFIIPYVARNESRKEFLIKRFFRIYPPLWTSITFIIALSILAGWAGLKINNAVPASIFNLFSAATLTNYLRLPQTPPINGGAWTLIIEVLFYSFFAIFYRNILKHPKAAMIAISFIFGTIFYFSKIGGHFHLFSAQCVFISYMFMGTLVFLRWAGYIKSSFFITATAVIWLLFLTGTNAITAQPLYTVEGYAISYGLAYIVFATVFRLEGFIRPGAILSHMAKISYSTYLLHGCIGLFILDNLYPLIGYLLSLVTALVFIFTASHFSHRFVEAPTQRLARELIGRKKALAQEEGRVAVL